MKRLIIFLMMLTVGTAISFAEPEPQKCGDYLYWSYDEYTKTLEIYGTGKMDDYLGNPSPWVDWRQKISNIILHEGITYIGFWAFYDFPIQTITIPSTVTEISPGAFKECGLLESVYFSNTSSLNSIGEEAFFGCHFLSTISLPNSVVKIGESAFENCHNLSTISLPSSITSIEDGTFAFTSLSTIPITNKLTRIGSRAFQYCPIDEITIPKSVTSIGEYAFEDTNWYDNQSDGLLFEDAWLLGYKGAEPVGHVIIPEGTKSIADGVFSLCEKITLVEIPSSMKYIGSDVFHACNNLADVYVLALEPPIVETCCSIPFSKYGFLHVTKGCKDSYANAEVWKNFKIVEIYDGANITMSSVGYMTYSNSVYNLDFTNVDGVKAYIASDYDLETGTLTITRVKNVPAGSGVLLIGEGGESYDVPATEKAHIQANLFVGVTDVDKVLEQTEGDYTNYYLSIVDGTVGFYKVAEGHTITIGVGKAYLPIKTSSSAAQSNGFIIEGISDEVTKINQIVLKDGDGMDGYIDLNGVRTNRLQSGKIYINTKTRNKLFVK